jgi:hypothetical protein
VITVRPLRLGDAARYSAFLARDPGNLVYASPPFLAFLERVTQGTARVLLAERDGDIIGALPYLQQTAPGIGPIVNSLPWYGSHGGCYLERSDPQADAIREALLRCFVGELEELAPLSATMILLPAENSREPLYRRLLQPVIDDRRIGQITELPKAGAALEQRLAMCFRQKTRNLVRKGLKQGFVEQVIDESWAWDFLWQTHTANIEALGGKAKPRAHFEALRRTLPSEMRRLSVALDGDRPVAALLLLSFGATVEYVTPAIDVRERSRQPLSFLIWKGMIEAIGAGRHFWNWGGTWIGQQSLHRFKAGFGATDRSYTYLVRASAEGIARLREVKPELSGLFPYFYVFPYAALEAADA